MGYTTAPQGDILSVRMEGVAAGWEQWFFLSSDWHWDNPHCDRVTLKRHLDQAVARKAGIFLFGDALCVMQGKYDPRASKAAVRPEHRVNNYLDVVVDDLAAWLRPYAPQVAVIAPGNHETNIEKRHETDLIGRIAKQLGVQSGGYAGFVRFMFNPSGRGQRTSKLLFYTHGSGGGAPVTKGVIDTNRKAVWLPDADIVYRGHNHHSWVVPVTRMRVSAAGKQFTDEQLHLDGGTYKQEFDLRGGYAIEKGFAPVSVGGIWLRFFWDNAKHGSVGMEATLAR